MHMKRALIKREPVVYAFAVSSARAYMTLENIHGHEKEFRQKMGNFFKFMKWLD